MTLDFTTDIGKQALQQLENETTIWLTTVTPSGVPQPNPVWFVWDNDSVLVWVQPESARMRNLAANAQVSLHFPTDPHAHHVTVLTGEAEIDESAPAVNQHETYAAKYAPLLPQIGLTPEEAAKVYSTALRIRPTKLRGF